MKVLDEMPKKGQFVAVWFVGGVPFSATLKWVDGQMKSYNHTNDHWDCECDHGYCGMFFDQHGATYFKGE